MFHPAIIGSKFERVLLKLVGLAGILWIRWQQPNGASAAA
jgi:hypothetical protein